MLQTLKNHKLIVIVAGVLMAGGISYGLFSGGPSSNTLITTSAPVTDSTVAGGDSDIVASLLALRAVSLDGTIFNNPAFLGLKDFGTEIVLEPQGRPNPFAPLPTTVLPTASTTKSAQIFTPRR